MRDVDVFARASPEHKLRLVKAIQANKQIVAMTGDGVNDAPALKKADIGVAMGIKGTEVTKEAAEMVLADDNFASITAAVREGRTVYNNIEKAILFMLPTNVAQALVIMVAIFFGFTLPITAPQVLWVNMVTSVALGLVISFDSRCCQSNANRSLTCGRMKPLGRQLTPLGQNDRAVLLKDVAAVEVTVLVEVVVDRGLNGGKFLQGPDVPEFRHGPLSRRA